VQWSAGRKESKWTELQENIKEGRKRRKGRDEG
jgi:hypothetical protein